LNVAIISMMFSLAGFGASMVPFMQEEGGKDKLENRNCMNQPNTLDFRVTPSSVIRRLENIYTSPWLRQKEQPHVREGIDSLIVIVDPHHLFYPCDLSLLHPLF
jgi:hypothetical protein